MNMTLSKRGDYVMRAAICLARAFDSEQPRKIREVVADTAVPRTFASQILADLVRAGLASSKAGREGGYRLVRHPSEISVLEVVEAAEGPLRAERCALGDGPCRWEKVCPLHETWSEATVALRDLLAATSLAVLAERDAAIESGAYAVPSDAHRSHPSAVTLIDVVHVELPAAEANVALIRAASRLPVLLESIGAGATPAGARSAPRRRRQSGTEASVVPVVRTADSNGTDASHFLLTWRITNPEHPSRFEAELSVSVVDPERAELRVEGTYSYDGAGVPPLASELERQGRSALRAFLRRLARSLEQETASAGALRRGRGA